MTRISVVGGACGALLLFAGICVAADVKRPSSSPTPPQPPSPNTANNDAARRAAAAQAAAQAAARNAAARSKPTPAQTTPQNNTTTNVIILGDGFDPYYRHRSYGYYSPYGYPYSPYGYPYSPYGTTPYVLGYNPYNGQGYLYPYGGYSPYGYGYSNYYSANPYLGYGYPSAVFVDPGQLYGLGPIQQLMGFNQGARPQQNVAPFANANPNAVVQGNHNDNNNANPGLDNGHQPAKNAPAKKPPAAADRKPAASNKSMELAWKFISFGDAQFGDLKYSDALERYRRAARECPTLGDAWFREGFAYAATGNYEQAAKAMHRGQTEKPDWADANFRLDELYGNNAADKQTRINGMLKAAEADPTNGDLAFVIGVHLYCDGKLDQAAPFFRREAQIQGNDAEVKPFLDKLRQ